MPVTNAQALTLTVARSVRAGDADAERRARAELAMHRIRRVLTGLAASGVRLSGEQAAEAIDMVCALSGGSARMRF